MTSNSLDLMRNQVSRRSLIRNSFLTSAGISLAGSATLLAGCSKEPDVQLGMAVLRKQDLVILERLIPAVIGFDAKKETSLTALIPGLLADMDVFLANTSQEGIKLIRVLLDLFAITPTRGFIGGLWAQWEDASNEEIKEFMDSWRNSNLGLLKMAYNQVCQMIVINWYANPAVWNDSFYPGPPAHQPTPLVV
jgi:hypothetical protein